MLNCVCVKFTLFFLIGLVYMPQFQTCTHTHTLFPLSLSLNFNHFFAKRRRHWNTFKIDHSSPLWLSMAVDHWAVLALTVFIVFSIISSIIIVTNSNLFNIKLPNFNYFFSPFSSSTSASSFCSLSFVQSIMILITGRSIVAKKGEGSQVKESSDSSNTTLEDEDTKGELWIFDFLYFVFSISVWFVSRTFIFAFTTFICFLFALN